MAELRIRYDQLVQTIMIKAKNAVTEYQQALRLYLLSSALFEDEKSLLNFAESNIEGGRKVDLFALVQIFQSYLAAGLRVETARTQFRISRAKINGKLLLGDYTQLTYRPASARTKAK